MLVVGATEVEFHSDQAKTTTSVRTTTVTTKRRPLSPPGDTSIRTEITRPERSLIAIV